jgi:N-acetyl-anhydromuramoyl-L-alanine amidase
MHPRHPFSVNVSTGLLEPARQVASPNHDPRPDGTMAELILVHGISLPPGEYGGPWIDRLFTNSLPSHVHPYFATVANLKVSSHLLIRRDGEVVQYVPFHRRAWHAGASSYLGRERCNDYSIGIELEGCDEAAYEPVQYARLTDVIVTLCAAYPALSCDRIAGHSDVSPGRKTDPGAAFDWPRLRAMIRSRAA